MPTEWWLNQTITVLILGAIGLFIWKWFLPKAVEPLVESHVNLMHSFQQNLPLQTTAMENQTAATHSMVDAVNIMNQKMDSYKQESLMVLQQIVSSQNVLVQNQKEMIAIFSQGTNMGDSLKEISQQIKAHDIWERAGRPDEPATTITEAT
jgi:hypothetical protein